MMHLCRDRPWRAGVIGSAGVLQPLHNLMRDVLLDSALIHMDETVVPNA
jgi:hypothetical protein